MHSPLSRIHNTSTSRAVWILRTSYLRRCVYCAAHDVVLCRAGCRGATERSQRSSLALLTLNSPQTHPFRKSLPPPTFHFFPFDLPHQFHHPPLVSTSSSPSHSQPSSSLFSFPFLVIALRYPVTPFGSHTIPSALPRFSFRTHAHSPFAVSHSSSALHQSSFSSSLGLGIETSDTCVQAASSYSTCLYPSSTTFAEDIYQ